MAKNQRESEEDRRKTDGSISTVGISPVLTVSETTLGGQDVEDSLLFDIRLTKVNLAVIDRLTIGSDVRFVEKGVDLVAYAEKFSIGSVSPKDRGRVQAAVNGGGRGWIRDIYDKGIMVRIET